MKSVAFKYQDIAMSLESRIASGEFRPGTPMPPEKVLSEQYSVNHLTFRKAMQILVESRRIVRIPGKGSFVLEEGTESGAKGTILYAGDLDSHFFKELYLSTLKASQISGMRLSTYDAASSHAASGSVKDLESRIADSDAVICNNRSLEIVAKFAKRHSKKLVLADIYDYGGELPPCHAIFGDVMMATRMATDHLFELGHRSIAFLGSPDKPLHGHDFGMPMRSRRSYQGYVISFFVAGIPVPDKLQFGPYGESVEECEKSVGAWLATLTRWPSAFVCEGDFRSLALVRAAARLKRRSPSDFSVVSTGNTPWAEAATPSLTSVSMGEKEIAFAAVLFAGCKSPDKPVIMRINPNMIKRESSSALKV